MSEFWSDVLKNVISLYKWMHIWWIFFFKIPFLTEKHLSRFFLYLFILKNPFGYHCYQKKNCSSLFLPQYSIPQKQPLSVLLADSFDIYSISLNNNLMLLLLDISVSIFICWHPQYLFFIILPAACVNMGTCVHRDTHSFPLPPFSQYTVILVGSVFGLPCYDFINTSSFINTLHLWAIYHSILWLLFLSCTFCFFLELILLVSWL